jgi:membrane protease subunit HflK
MPWTNNGGPWTPGGPPKGGPGPWGRPPSGAPDLEDLIRRGQDQLRQALPSGFGGRGLIVLLLVGLLVWLASGFYTVATNQVGLNLIFGRYTGKTKEGLNYNLPYPVGSVLKLDVTDFNVIDIGSEIRVASRTQSDVPEESLMLTGDENIADVKFRVVWKIDDVKPEDYAFNVSNPPGTVKAVAESAMREIVGHSQIQKLLTAERKVIEPAVQDLMQRVLDNYQAGVRILQVQLLSVDPPASVISAFRDVTAAQQDRDRLKNEAEAYANKVVPEARGQSARITQEAEAYREQTVAEATGQASRFSQVYEQYKRAPDLTRERLYLETMERVLGNADKVILDKGGSNVVPWLPLTDAGRQTPPPPAVRR